MKAKHFYLLTEQIRSNAIAEINSAVLDGKTKVSVSPAGSKSARQRGLQHIWYRDVARSGIGGIAEESEKNIDVKAKREFAMPIIYKDPEKYHYQLTLYYLVSHRLDQPEFESYFFVNHVHTEDFDTSEMAEFLTAFQVYYTGHGVNLTDPVDKKLLEHKDRFKTNT
jgi:hypothetical protein